MSVLLIMSGAYLNPEFTAEFGKLPPTFLPAGNRRLYEWQIEALKHVPERIVMALPEDFVVGAIDSARLESLGVEIVRMPRGLSLGAGIVFCLNVCRGYDRPVYLLHGDTLVGAEDLGETDTVLTAPTSDYYTWAGVERAPEGGLHFHESLSVEQNPREILCGYFTFSDPALLIGSIARAENDFIAGVNQYATEKGLRAKPAIRWLDFGHVQLYYQSKAHMTTQRAFNMLNTSRRSVFKSSDDEDKIRAEAAWLNALPAPLRLYTPTFMGTGERDGRFGYRTEYLHLSTLSELLLFGRLPASVWRAVFDGCDEFLSAAAAVHPPESSDYAYAEDHGAKTLRRLETFAAESDDIDIDVPCRFGAQALPSLRNMVETCAEMIAPPSRSDIGLWHGDFCFSNLFYDFRAQQIKVIDPRGRDFANRHSPFGDRRYDVAKLAHSVLGQYDSIIAGHFALTADSPLALALELPRPPELVALQTAFGARKFGGIEVGGTGIKAMTTLLFFSMLPLHSDSPSRQRALLANGMRLFSELLV